MIETPRHRLNDAHNAYHEIFRNIPDGLTFLAFHFNAPGDFEIVEPEYAHIRTDEYALFMTPQIAEWLREYGLEAVGFRKIRHKLTSALSRPRHLIKSTARAVPLLICPRTDGAGGIKAAPCHHETLWVGRAGAGRTN
ncbi:MAG TPA: hypothetical protein VGY91_15795 [Chthoniobacterales bacterium]|jgi:hypothetical protein|nr:hypothetical protein [Chthoniobacterales bacterium]